MVIAGVLVLGTAVLIVSVVYLASPREPTYQGKTLSEWIAPFCKQTAKGLDAPGGPQHFEELQPSRRAVKEIGTNAIPFLNARLNHRESELHRTARRLLEKQPFAALRLTDPYVSKIRAIRALASLGEEVRPALPILKAQLADATLSEHALYALLAMGPEGMRALVEEYTNSPAPVRVQLATTICFPTLAYRGKRGIHVDYETNAVVVAAMIEGLCRIAQDHGNGCRVPRWTVSAGTGLWRAMPFPFWLNY